MQPIDNSVLLEGEGVRAAGDTLTTYVQTRHKTYPLYIGTNLHKEIALRYSERYKCKEPFIVYDSNIDKNIIVKIESSLRELGIEGVRLLDGGSGEVAKGVEGYTYLCEEILRSGVDRHTPIMVIGGGALGDVVGFCASTILRGLPWIIIPSTLLACCDSSIGGKTAINSSMGKNLIGTIHQPDMVFMDTNILRGLSDRIYISGYAELIKHALIKDKKLFQEMRKNYDKVLRRETETIKQIIHSSCKIKSGIVSGDEREEGEERVLLNFGHTFAHALESHYGYDSEKISHGEAVSQGMRLASHLSLDVEGGISGAEVYALESHLVDVGLPTEINVLPRPIPTAKEMLELMKRDKKHIGGRINLVLLRGIGEGYLHRDYSEEKLLKFLTKEMEGVRFS